MNELEEYAYQEQIKDLREELTQRDMHLRKLMKENAQLETLAGFQARPIKPPRWLRPPRRKSSEHIAIPMLMMSDLHLDEVVDPSELSGHNAYNREIATLRLRKMFEDTIKITHHYWKGITYQGITLIAGGDIFTGLIHGEFDRTNDGNGPYESLEFWVPQFVAGINLLADTYGRVFIPWTVGNHGRFRQGPWQHKRRVQESIDWALGMRLRAYFAQDDRVDFLIPDDPDVPFEVFDVRFLLNHGQTGGGAGIGGIFPPIFRKLAGLRKRWEFDVGTFGHWHQDIFTPEQGLIINGALKGYDEFSRDCHFAPEKPSQSLWLVTPENGITWHAPVLVRNRRAEGW